MLRPARPAAPAPVIVNEDPSASVSPARSDPVIDFFGPLGGLAGAFRTSVVLPTAPLDPLNVSSSATGASVAHSISTVAVAVSPRLTVEVNVSLPQALASGG